MKNAPNQIQLILLVYIATILSIAFNVPILRQVSSFIFLTFIPGFLILKIMKLEKRNVTDKILFSVGLSIAFLMFVGLLINELYPLIGISRPLSILPLTITVMSLTIALLFLDYRLNSEKVTNIDYEVFRNLKALAGRAILLSLPIFLGIFGALYHSVPLLLLMIIIIVAVLALAVFSRKVLPTHFYPWVILAVGLGLLLHMSLISKYNLGCDNNPEYYAFTLTDVQGHWEKPGTVLFSSSIANVRSMLSVTIWPTTYSVFLGMNGEIMFKLLYLFIFSLIPIALYRVCEQQQTGKTFALLSALFFMSTPYSFYGIEPLSLGKQIVAELFLMLSVFLIVNKDITLRNRRLLLMIFGAGIVVSHYSLSYIYLLFVVSIFAIFRIQGKKGRLDEISVLFLITMTFSWYIYVSNSPLLGLTNASQHILTSFNTDLINPAARSSFVFSILDPSTVSGVVGLVHRLLGYTQNILVLIGVIILGIKSQKTSFTREYRYFSILSGFILLSTLLIPNFAPSLGISRFYQITLLFLAPSFVLGGEAVIELAKKLPPFSNVKTKILRPPQVWRDTGIVLVTALLLISFLFQVGLVNRVTGSLPFSSSIDLDRKLATTTLGTKVSLYELYIPEQDVFGAKWYLRNANQTSWVYADAHSMKNVLVGYALLTTERTRYLFNATVLEHGAYIYLRTLNVLDNTVLTERNPLNTSEIPILHNGSNQIYTNGASEIYYAP